MRFVPSSAFLLRASSDIFGVPPMTSGGIKHKFMCVTKFILSSTSVCRLLQYNCRDVVFVKKTRYAPLVFFIVPLFIYLTVVNSRAITIDGIAGRSEWEGSVDFTIVNIGEQSNCDIVFATVKTIIADDENRLYIELSCKAKGEAEDGSLIGAEFCINGGDMLSVFYDEQLNICDQYYYSLESAFIHDKYTKTFCGEICIGIKFGVPQAICLGIRIFDFGGIPSNYYTVMIYKNNGGENQKQSCGTERHSSTTETSTCTTKTQTTMTTTTKKAETTAQRTSAVFTTVAHVPVELFRSETSKTKATQPRQETSAEKTAPPNTAGSVSSVHKETEPHNTAPATKSDTEAFAVRAYADIEPAADEWTADDVGELGTGGDMGRKKAIGIAVAAALLSAAVLDALITGGFKRTKKTTTAQSGEETDK